MPKTSHVVPHQLSLVVFTMACLLGIIIIVMALALEWTRVRTGRSTWSMRVFRWRAISGFVWVLVFGSLAYAVWFLWPTSGDRAALLKFSWFMLGAMLLIIVGFVLLAIDARLVAQEIRQGKQHLQREHADLLRDIKEAERAKQLAGNYPSQSPGPVERDEI